MAAPTSKDAGCDDRFGEGDVDEREHNGRDAQRLDQPQGQILEIGRFLQVVEIVVVEESLADTGDEEQFQVEPVLLVQGRWP